MNQTSRQRQVSATPRPNISPPLACILHHVVAGGLSVQLHDRLVVVATNNNDGPSQRTTRVAVFLGAYWVWLLSFRLWTAKSKALALQRAKQPATANAATLYATSPTAMIWYEMPWLCNMTLVVSAGALVTNRPSLALAYGLTVAIDQLLWFLDGILLLTTRRTVVGVFRHIFLPTTRWYHHLTTWHHLWTLPLLVLAAWPNLPASAMTESAAARGDAYRFYLHVWILSAAVMTLNVLSSRVLTPFGILVKSMDDNASFFYYLNVNLSYQVWKDLSKSISFLRIQEDRPSTPVYLTRLLVRWMFLNTVIWLAFVCVLEIMSGHVNTG